MKRPIFMLKLDYGGVKVMFLADNNDKIDFL